MSRERNTSKSSGSAHKLSDTQLVLLSAAAQRDDHCLTTMPKLKGGAARDTAEKASPQASSRSRTQKWMSGAIFGSR